MWAASSKPLWTSSLSASDSHVAQGLIWLARSRRGSATPVKGQRPSPIPRRSQSGLYPLEGCGT